MQRYRTVHTGTVRYRYAYFKNHSKIKLAIQFWMVINEMETTGTGTVQYPQLLSQQYDVSNVY